MRFIKIDKVIEMTGKPRASIYRDIKAGKFVKQVPRGDRSVAWVEQEVLDWMADRVKERDAVNNV